MAAEDWELIDTGARSVLAVGSWQDCFMARLDVLQASLAYAISPGELVVRPRRGFGLPAR